MANSQLSRVQILKIGTFMEPLLLKDKAGYVEYKEGWDDLKVAHKFQVTEANIVRLRKDLFGKFSPVRAGSPMSHIWERIASLEARINAIESRERLSNDGKTWTNRMVNTLNGPQVTPKT